MTITLHIKELKQILPMKRNHFKQTIEMCAKLCFIACIVQTKHASLFSLHASFTPVRIKLERLTRPNIGKCIE